MINEQLQSYVKGQLALKVSKETIINNLKGAGWTDADMAEVFSVLIPATPAMNPVANPVASPMSQATQMNSPFITPTISSSPMSSPMMNQAQPQYHEIPATKKSGGGKKIFAVIVIIVLLILAGGGAYAYYTGYFITLPSLLSKTIIQDKNIKTATYDVTVNIDASQIQDVTGLNQIFSGSSKQFNLTTQGSFDNSDSNNTKGSSTISINAGSVSLGAEFRLLNDTMYGSATKIPAMFTLFMPNISTYENKWFSFPLNLIKDGQSSGNPLTGSINPTVVGKLTSEQKDHILTMTQSASFIKTTQKFSPETVGGELSYHFAFDLDRAGIAAYLQSLKEYINTIGKDDSTMSAFDPTTLTTSLDKVKDFKGEIWIGRNDSLVHKVSVSFGVTPDATKNEQVKVSLVGIFSLYNQPVSIVAPVDSTPFSDLIANMMNTSTVAKPAKVVAPKVK